jgi:hypothetical protein
MISFIERTLSTSVVKAGLAANGSISIAILNSVPSRKENHTLRRQTEDDHDVLSIPIRRSPFQNEV